MYGSFNKSNPLSEIVFYILWDAPVNPEYDVFIILSSLHGKPERTIAFAKAFYSSNSFFRYKKRAPLSKPFKLE